MALQTFEGFGMVEIIDGVITIPNWGKHQSLDQMENRKEFMRNYMRDYREKQKALTSGKPNCKPNSKPNVRRAEEEVEEEIERDKEKIDYKGICDTFNAICVSFPSIRTISESRKKAIKARLKTYSLDDFRILFEKAEASSFLKGKNNSNWSASFDWLIKDANMIKVLEGNYDDKDVTYRPSGNKQTKAEELDDFYAMAKGWAES
jgi:hypothetical protein